MEAERVVARYVVLKQPNGRWQRLAFVDTKRRLFRRRLSPVRLSAAHFIKLRQSELLVRLTKGQTICGSCDLFLTPSGQIVSAPVSQRARESCQTVISDVSRLSLATR